jgi:hypothetical protein
MRGCIIPGRTVGERPQLPRTESSAGAWCETWLCSGGQSTAVNSAKGCPVNDLQSAARFGGTAPSCARSWLALPQTSRGVTSRRVVYGKARLWLANPTQVSRVTCAPKRNGPWHCSNTDSAASVVNDRSPGTGDRHLTGVSTPCPDGAGVCCREHAVPRRQQPRATRGTHCRSYPAPVDDRRDTELDDLSA